MQKYVKLCMGVRVIDVPKIQLGVWIEPKQDVVQDLSMGLTKFTT